MSSLWCCRMWERSSICGFGFGFKLGRFLSYFSRDRIKFVALPPVNHTHISSPSIFECKKTPKRHVFKGNYMNCLQIANRYMVNSQYNWVLGGVIIWLAITLKEKNCFDNNGWHIHKSSKSHGENNYKPKLQDRLRKLALIACVVSSKKWVPNLSSSHPQRDPWTTYIKGRQCLRSDTCERSIVDSIILKEQHYSIAKEWN